MVDVSGIQLDIWSGDFGLPSIDPQCLAVMVYCKFASVPYNVRYINSPQKSPTGELPALILEDSDSLTKVNDIFNYLRKHRMGTDYDLTGKQSADIVAFTAMLEEKLVPGLLQLYWHDVKTYADLTYPWFIKNMNFPYNYIFPLFRHRQNKSRLSLCAIEDASEEEIETKMYRDAKECLNSLEAKLGDNKYFFGEKPSSLDAIILGYLAPLLKSPVPTPVLQNHLKGCPNLCRFCEQILDAHYPSLEQAKAEEKCDENSVDVTDFPHKKRNIAVSSLIAVTAMTTYALYSGLLNQWQKYK